MNSDQAFSFSESVAAAVAKQFEATGIEWLAAQSMAVTDFLVERDLQVTEYMEGGLAINEICGVAKGSQHFVLKTGYPEPELFTEIRVLHHWRGKPDCVQLVDVDETNGILLLERVSPGTTFRQEPIETRSHFIPISLRILSLSQTWPLSRRMKTG